MDLSVSNHDQALRHAEPTCLDAELCACGRPFKHFKGFDPTQDSEVCFDCWIKRLISMEK